MRKVARDIIDITIRNQSNKCNFIENAADIIYANVLKQELSSEDEIIQFIKKEIINAARIKILLTEKQAKILLDELNESNILPDGLGADDVRELIALLSLEIDRGLGI